MKLLEAPPQHTCVRCSVTKELCEFKKQATYKTGHDNTCRTCRNEDRRTLRKARTSDIPKSKHCPRCNRTLPGSAFGAGNTPDGRFGVCKDCKNLRAKVTRFNITESEYWSLLLAQGSTCAVCHVEGLRTTAYHIDHDHKCCPNQDESCGLCIRGLLCPTCNVLTIAGYEKYPAEFQTWDVINQYLVKRPIQELRRT